MSTYPTLLPPRPDAFIPERPIKPTPLPTAYALPSTANTWRPPKQARRVRGREEVRRGA